MQALPVRDEMTSPATISHNKGPSCKSWILAFYNPVQAKKKDLKKIQRISCERENRSCLSPLLFLLLFDAEEKKYFVSGHLVHILLML